MTYKDFEKEYIGYSDIAALILAGGGENEMQTSPLYFGSDGSYQAYIVSGNPEIGEHYTLVNHFKRWLRIYDDDTLTAKYYADDILIYRAGDFGCIIELRRDTK